MNTQVDPFDAFARKVAEHQAAISAPSPQRALSWKGEISPSIIVTLVANLVGFIVFGTSLSDDVKTIGRSVTKIEARVDKLTQDREQVVRLEERFGAFQQRMDRITSALEKWVAVEKKPR